MKNKVLIINSSNQFWGAEHSLLILLRALSGNEFELVVRSDGNDFGKQLKNYGIAHNLVKLELSPKKIGFWKSAFVLLGQIFKKKVTCVYGNNEDLSSLLAVIRIFSFFIVKTTIHIRNQPMKFDYYKKLMFLHSSIICNSNFSKKCLLDSCPLYFRSKIYIVANAHGQSTLHNRTTLDHNYNIIKPRQFFLTVGMINERKAQLDVVRSLKGLGRSNNLNYVIVGSVPKKNSYHKTLESYINEHNLSDMIFVYPFEKEIGWFYSRAIATIVPSISETFGRVVIESGFHGTPVIVRDIEPLRELVSHGETGLVWNGSNEHLIVLMKTLIDDKNYRDHLGDNLKDKVVSEFSDENYIKSVKNIIWKHQE